MIVVVAVMWAGLVSCDNPLVPNVGMADPHAHVFNNTVYIYSTHDFSPNNTGFRMDDWWVWRTTDLVTYQQVSLLKPMAWIPASARHECWATDAAARNGKYYFFVSVGPLQVAVVSSTKPDGPWEDPLGKPLLPASLGKSLKPPTQIRDPCAFADVDGNYYIFFGTFEYYIAKLTPNMTALAEHPKHVTVINAIGVFGPGKTDDKPFLHVRNGLYYLSWGCFYATGTSPYGPFTYRGSVVDPALIAPGFHIGNTSAQPWYHQEDYVDRHGSFFELHGQWYYLCNDRSHSPDKGHEGKYRDVVGAYVHYLTNGSIAPVKINKHGIGQHDAALPIQAEEYFMIQGAKKQEHPLGGFQVVGLGNGSSLQYNVKNVHSITTVTLHLSNAYTTGEVQIHTSPGRIVVCSVPSTGSWETYVDVRCSLGVVKGPRIELTLAFVSGDDVPFARLDYLVLGW